MSESDVVLRENKLTSNDFGDSGKTSSQSFTAPLEQATPPPNSSDVSSGLYFWAPFDMVE